MSTVNAGELVAKLEELVSISHVSGSTNPDDILSSALSASLLNEVSVITVQTIGDLPNLYYFSSPSGMLYYVVEDEIFAISVGLKWQTLDRRILRQDSSTSIIYGFGANNFGQLGDKTVTNRSSPVAVVGGFTDWCQVSAGGDHSLGVRQNGTVWAWGINSAGQLGDGTVVSKLSPVSVVGGFTDWCQVSAGQGHSLGLRINGSLLSWGGNASGQLGDGTSSSKIIPVPIFSGFTDWFQVSAGSIHSLGIRSNGTAWAWGSGNSGRLGDGTTTNRSSPVSVVGGFTDWCQVSAGAAHSLGIRSNGTAWAWGYGFCGSLGDGTDTNKSSPVSVVGGFTDWCQISAGYCHSLGIRSNGTAWAWGYGFCGRLGDGTDTNKSSPVSVAGGFTDWCQVSAGLMSTLSIRNIC
jgi:alpha-tubulin suppressor-like RCC1 family protein